MQGDGEGYKKGRMERGGKGKREQKRGGREERDGGGRIKGGGIGCKEGRRYMDSEESAWRGSRVHCEGGGCMEASKEQGEGVGRMEKEEGPWRGNTVHEEGEV